MGKNPVTLIRLPVLLRRFLGHADPFGFSTDAALGGTVKSGKISLLDRADFI
jgi:hypothetical protein